MYVSSEQLQPMPIVLVDDDAFNIAVLTRMLTRAGYRNVHSTTRSSEAVALARQSGAELVILDLHMPAPNGFQLLEELSSEPQPPEVLILTADTDTATRIKALGLGARDFLARPVENIDLLLHTRNLLELRYLSRQLDLVAAQAVS